MKKALMLCAAVLLLLSLCACSTLARSIAGASSAASSAVNSYGDAAGAVSRPEDSGNDSRFVSGEEDPYSAREDSAASGETSGAQNRAFGLDSFRKAYEQAGFTTGQGDDPDTLRVWRGNDPTYYEIRLCASAKEAAEKAKEYEKSGRKTTAHGSVLIAYPRDFANHKDYIAPFESIW